MNDMINHAAVDETALFPIGTVSEQTGVNTVTLRAWERRYGLLKPRRTPKGHRLYSQQDVERVKQVLILLDQGIPVSRVRDVLDSDRPHLPLLVTVKDAQTDDPWRYYYTLLQRCIYKLDTRSLEHTFNEVASLYPLDLMAKKLLTPLYQQLRQQAQLLPSTTADYAFLHEFLCARLGSRYLQYNSRANGKRILLLNAHASNTQIERLLIANILSNHGYQISLLGMHIAPDHLPLVLERTQFEAIILVGECQMLEPMYTLVAMNRIPLFLHTQQDRGDTWDPPEDLPVYWLPDEMSDISQAVDTVLENADP
jgi:DNA-binding transcriptional MerR regulator